ncbi:MAG TPA: DUF1320 domain-containing protein [Azospirillum sp.]|nr:DUF1320 domain-containing protein [Azospirillum sp.]
MVYASQSDIIDAYGIDLLTIVADRDGDGEIDAKVVDRALTSASAIIDAHVLGRYPAPWPAVPDLVRDVCVDIAIYKLSAEGNGLTDERRRRYEDALALLKRISSGLADLDIPAATSAPAIPDSGVMLDEAPRMFGHNALRGW